MAHQQPAMEDLERVAGLLPVLQQVSLPDFLPVFCVSNCTVLCRKYLFVGIGAATGAC